MKKNIILPLFIISSKLIAGGFTPQKVGLNGDIIKDDGKFKVIRMINGKQVPHKGVDITSRVNGNPSPKDFTPGVWGKVDVPNSQDSGWKTITISPFRSPSTRLQFMHASSLSDNAKVGNVVAPWTILGKTGNTVPPDDPPVEIHLHLQVEDPSGETNENWKERKFINPEIWDTGNPVSQDWKFKNYKQEDVEIEGKKYQLISEMKYLAPIRSDEINSTYDFTISLYAGIAGLSWCQRTYQRRHTVKKHEGNVFYVEDKYLNCKAEPSDCGCSENDNPDWPKVIEITLLSQDNLQMGDYKFNKAAIYREQFLPSIPKSETGRLLGAPEIRKFLKEFKLNLHGNIGKKGVHP